MSRTPYTLDCNMLAFTDMLAATSFSAKKVSPSFSDGKSQRKS
jgi:hypothetical protein